MIWLYDKMEELKKPTKKMIEEYKEKFHNNQNEGFEHYSFQEKAIQKLKNKFPKNKDIYEILLKVGILNSFYSTNIFKPFAVARNIESLDIDERLSEGDPSLVHDIAKNTISRINKNFYSFATKYCSMHNPKEYPIYDRFIARILTKYKKQEKFARFTQKDLKNYSKFKDILRQFKKHFDLEEFSFKEIDQFLWLYEKELQVN